MEQHVFSVTEVNQYIKSIIDGVPQLGDLLIRGELSNYKVYPSGHHYFTLKDGESAIRCVMFRSSAGRLRFRPESGMQVIAGGRISVYPRDGAYQLYCTSLSADGIGDLYVAFEQLKDKLNREGLFDPAHKKPLPLYPRRIAIVTSSAGAAVHDMIRILRRRYPIARVLLLPVRVQGVEAPPEIVGAIRYANRWQLADVLIVGRGGGSIEDLWAFNEEAVAQAVFDCSVPVISAVGHETDTTIIDFVSDLRAPTPSAAAELAVYDVRQLLELLQERKTDLGRRIRSRLDLEKLRLEQRKQRMQYLSPANQIREKRMQAIRLEEDLNAAMRHVLEDRRNRLRIYVEKLKGLSPLDKLSQGFSRVEDGEGRTVSDIEQIHPGDLLTVYVKNGRALAEVKEAAAWNPQELAKGEKARKRLCR